jgi:hypothetical protein
LTRAPTHKPCQKSRPGLCKKPGSPAAGFCIDAKDGVGALAGVVDSKEKET